MNGRLLPAILAGAMVIALAAPAPAPASHAKSCGIVAKGSHDYRVKARVMKCKYARKWARTFLRRRRPAPGFKCTNPPDRDIPFFCFRGSKAYWVVRL